MPSGAPPSGWEARRSSPQNSRHRRWKPWILIAATILCGAAGFAYSTAQQTLYASTSSVLYLPTPGSSTKSVAGDWGITRAPLAESTEFAGLVLRSLNPRIPGLTPSQLQKQTTVAAIPAGNGLQFTVSDPKSLGAQRLADGYSSEFPVYLAAHTPNPELQSTIVGLNDVKYKLANTPAGTSQVQIVEWRANEILYTAKIKEIEATVVPTRLTSTLPHPGSSPVQTQPNTARTIAIGALIGFVFGTLLTLLLYIFNSGAPTPPRAVVG